MTTDPAGERPDSSWRWATGPEDAPKGPPGLEELSMPARRLGWFIAAAGVVIAVSAWLPWKTAGSIHVNGTAGDGILTLVFGFVAAIAGLGRVLNRRQSRWRTIWPVIGSSMAAATVLIAYTDVEAVAKIATVGFGLLLTLFGGFALAATSVVALMRRT